MKVLIAYDGSESADTAIDGLRRAGLPIHVRLKSSLAKWKSLNMSAVEIRPRLDVEEKPHCGRCDSEGRRLIKFTSPNGRTHYLCALCVAQEDKREMKFSPLWRRSRRPPRVH